MGPYIKLFKQLNDPEAVVEVIRYLVGYLSDRASDVDRFLGIVCAIAGSRGIQVGDDWRRELGVTSRELKGRFRDPWTDLLFYFANEEGWMQKLIEYSPFQHACLVEGGETTYTVTRKDARGTRPWSLDTALRRYRADDQTGATCHLVLVISDELYRVLNLPRAVTAVAG